MFRQLTYPLALIALSTTGHAEVSNTGEFQTRVTIEVPTMRGLSPAISLSYSASRPSGIAGVGWGLDASSMIARTGPRGGLSVAPAAPDAFELDGEPLVPCASGSTSPSCTTAVSAFGSSAGFFSTRRESFSRIQYDSTANAWNVWATNGHVARYVTFDGGQRWLLASRTDRHGNAIAYAYRCAAGTECELETIKYGGYNAKGAEVHFYYEARPDVLRRTNGKVLTTAPRRLRSITVEVDGQLARAYGLTYSGSARSILASVTQYASDAIVDKTTDPGRITAGPTPPLPSTTFSNGGGGTGWRTAALASPGMFAINDLFRNAGSQRYRDTYVPNNVEKSGGVDGDYSRAPFQPLIGDFDGDSRTDFVNVYVSKKCMVVGVNGVLTRKGGFDTIAPRDVASFPSAGTSGCTPRTWVADIDGDHRDDLVVAFRDTLYVARFSGSSFKVDPTTTPWTLTAANCGIGDVDGDLRDDLVCLADLGGGPLIVTAKSRGNATWNVSSQTIGYPTTTPFAMGDINNDGLTDAVLAPATGSTRSLVTMLSTGGGYTTETQTTPWAVVNTDRITATDVDGDGLADVMLTRTVSTLKAELAMSIEGATTDRYELRTLPVNTAQLGDVDGDGRMDLIDDTLAWIGDGNGGFFSPVNAFPQTYCPTYYLTDTDGDGRTDRLCTLDDGTGFILDDYEPSTARRDLHRWMSGDIDGDGRTDYAYVWAMNPGIGVLTVLTSTNRRVYWEQFPTATLPGLDDSSATHWILTDVGGPNGTPDGKDDLVMVDTDGTKLRVYTMLANGDGTYAARVHQGLSVPNASDLGNYWPLDLDGNGTTDLLHMAPSITGVRTDTLLSRGDGTWASRSTYYFGGANPKIVGATSFRPMDVNGDNLVDLVHAYSGVGVTGTAIRVLVNRGDGTFGEVDTTVPSSHADVAHWLPFDINGDGTTDLVHASSATSQTGSGFIFESLLSRGDGQFVQGNITTAWLDASTQPDLRRALESPALLMPADTNGDGVLDLWHVSQYRDAAGVRRMMFVELRNPNTNPISNAWWPVGVSQPGAAIPASPPWAWRHHRDADRLDTAGLEIVDGNAGRAYIRDLPSERIVRIDNGTGGATTVAYAPLLGARAYLPSGMVPIVTTEVSKLDYAYQPTLTERTTYAYNVAQWSWARGSWAFGYVTTTGPRTAVATTYAIDDACGGTPLVISTIDAATNKTLAFTQRALVAPGSAPYTCLVQQEADYACDSIHSCRRETVVDLTYDAYGNVVSAIEQVTNGPTRYDYVPVVAKDAAYIVDQPGSRSVYQDAGSGLTLLRYDAYVYTGGDLNQILHWDSTTQRYLASQLEYDSFGLMTRTVDPAGTWVETSYDPDHHAFPIRTCSAAGCITNVWDKRFGVQTSGVDLNGGVTTYVYDAHGRLVTTTNPDGTSTTSRILAHGVVWGIPGQRQRVRVETKDDSADGVLWSETLIDGTGRKYRTMQENGANQLEEYTDASARPSRVSEVFAAGTTPARWTTYTYDALGRMTQQTAPDNTRRRWVYRSGEVDTIDELGHTRTLEMDGRGEVIQVTERLNGADVITKFGYDAEHRLVGSVDARGNTTSYYYDTLGRMIGERDPDRGVREYAYYANARVRTAYDAKGQRTEYAYDALGRTTTRTDHDATGNAVRTIRWTYDELPGAGPQGASRGRIVRIDDHQAKTDLRATYHYDAGGRVDRDEQCIDGDCYKMSRKFDSAGRLQVLTYPDGEDVEHVYDDAGHLVRVGDYMTQATYTIDGLPDSMKFGNGIETRWNRDPARRWTDSMSISNTYDATYLHAANGAIAHLSEKAPTGQVSYDYTYDDLGRLTDVTASDPQLSRKFGYDAIGRMTLHSQHGKYTYGDPAHVHAVTGMADGGAREYDQNGNATRIRDANGRDLRIDWTVDDRPSAFDSASGRYEMAYDAFGSRVKKEGPTSARYFSAYFAQENGQPAKYYFAGDVLVARNVKGDVTYYHQDQVRAVRATTDASGNVTGSYQFDAYGAAIVRNAPSNDDIAFGTVHNDPDLDLVYMNARYYDPTSARFVSADSVVRNALAPQSLDRYAYVEGDPINHIDPSGHMRRDIELMKERKEMWRALMVEFEQRFASYCEPFCTTAVTSTVVVWQGNKVVYVAQAGSDPAIAAYQWGKAFPAKPAATPEASKDHAAVKKEGTNGEAANNGGGGGGGGGGGCSARSPASCVASLVMGFDGEPDEGAVSIKLGTEERVKILIPDGPFTSVVVTFTIAVDEHGKITNVRVGCTGLCPKEIKKEYAPDSTWVIVHMTKPLGSKEVVEKSGSDEKTLTNVGANSSGTTGGKLDGKVSGDVKAANVSAGQELSGSSTMGLQGGRTWEEGRNQSSSVTLTQDLLVESHEIAVRVYRVGKPPPAAPEVIKKGVKTQ